MAIENPAPAARIRQAVVIGVDNFIKPNDPLRDSLKNPKDGLQVFSMGLKSIAAGADIDAAKPVGWRFMVRSGEDAAAALVLNTLGDVSPRMSSLSRGPEVAKAIDVKSQLEKLVQTQDQSYEIRVLRVPGVFVEAYWLQPKVGAGWVIPFISVTPGFDVGQAYRPRQFLDTIRPLAEKRLAFDNKTAGQ